jgi:hypothetical protein
MFQDAIVPVLVNEDTIYRREDHSKRLLLYGRPGRVQGFTSLFPQHQPISAYLSGEPWLEQVARPKSPESALYPFRQIKVTQPSGQNLNLLTVPRPKPQFFEDRFVSVYPVVEVADQNPTTFFTPPQPGWLYFNKNRPSPTFFEDHSLETGQTNHPYPNVIQIGIGLFPYTFEIPDLTSEVWAEQVHRPPNPEIALYPFRQIYINQSPQQIMLQMFYKSPNWQVEAEPIWRVPDQQTLTQFRWQIVIPMLPNVVGFPQAAAISLLSLDGFNNVSIILLPSTTVPSGIVIAQAPLAGPQPSFNIPVTLTVSIGTQPTGTKIMPNVVGVILQQALKLLQDAGVLVPSAIGYFGTYPITVNWLPVAKGRHNAAYIGDFGIVHAQSIIPGSAVRPNTPITLTVSSFPDPVAFP